jgi:hypothetical protein
VRGSETLAEWYETQQQRGIQMFQIFAPHTQLPGSSHVHINLSSSNGHDILLYALYFCKRNALSWAQNFVCEFFYSRYTS